MKKFKLIYYILYGLVVLLILYIASDVISVMQTIREWGWFTYYSSELPIIASRFYYFIAFVMIVSVGVENYFTYRKRNERKKLEQEVLTLKAKLYDRDVEQKASPEPSEVSVTVTTESGSDQVDDAIDVEQENPKEGE